MQLFKKALSLLVITCLSAHAADVKISNMTALTAPEQADEFVIVDKSDTTQAASGSTKKITLRNLIGNPTNGSLMFASNGALAQDNSNLFFEDTNNTLSLGSNSVPSGFSYLAVRNSTDVVGTVSNSAGGTTVTGVGTAFLRSFQQGDLITVNGETRTVLSVASDTSLTTDTWTGANSGVAYTATAYGAGRITTTAGGTTVTGTGTAFLSQFSIGDTLKAGGETRTVASIASNSSMTTDAWTGANTTVSYEVFKKLLSGVTKSGFFFLGNAGPTTFTTRANYDLVNAGTVTAFNAAAGNAQTSISTSTNNQMLGGSYTATVGARNTQNWTDSIVGQSGIAGQTGIQSGASGTITTAKGGRFNVSNSSSSATITNAYGLVAFDNFSNSGTITNTYGFYVGDLTTGTQTNTPFSFYASDASAIGLYSAGKVGINQTAPTSMLDVVASSSSTIGHIVKGAASQTANLQEWRNSSDSVKAAINPNGYGIFSNFAYLDGLGSSAYFAYVGGDILSDKALAPAGGFRTTIGQSGLGLGTTPSGAYQTIVSAGDIVLEPVAGGAVVINDAGADKDFRVEGDTKANLFFLDASADKIGIDTSAPTDILDVNGDTLRLRTSKTPASATATCDAGEISWDADYVYVCIATDTWKRSAIATW